MDYDEYRDESSLIYVASDFVMALVFVVVAVLAAGALIGLGLWLI